LEPVELTVALWHYTIQPEFPNTLNAFRDRYSHVSFDIIDTVNANFEEVVITQLAGGRALDVIFILGPPLHSNLVGAGQLMDLTDFVNELNRDGNLGTAPDIIRTEDDRFFAVPWRQDFWGLFYNKDLFEAAGEPLPENLTWDEYRDLAIRLTQGEGIDKIYGSHLHTWNIIPQGIAGAQAGQSLINTDYSFMADMYNLRLDLMEAGAIMDFGTILAANVGYRPRFEDQLAAMIPMGSWYLGELAERATFNWGIAPMPQRPGATGVTTLGNVTPIGIGANANNPEEAMRFIQFATGEEGALILADVGIPAAFSSPRVTDAFFSLPGMPQDELSMRAFNPDVVVREWPIHPLSGIASSILGEEHQLILIRDNTVEEGLQRMAERVGAEIERHN
jgi:multiple sugar transport system substrate-binding protein